MNAHTGKVLKSKNLGEKSVIFAKDNRIKNKI